MKTFPNSIRVSSFSYLLLLIVTWVFAKRVGARNVHHAVEHQSDRVAANICRLCKDGNVPPDSANICDTLCPTYNRIVGNDANQDTQLTLEAPVFKCSTSREDCTTKKESPLIPTKNADPPGATWGAQFNTWSGHLFEFQGACDLVLLQHPNYAKDLGLDIHIRTNKSLRRSFIESAALRIGSDILQVSGWGEYVFRGVQNTPFPVMMGGVGIVSHQQRSTKTHVFEVELDKTTKIVFDTFMDMVSVSVIANNSAEDFSGSVGLLGANGTGRMLARDGTTPLENDVTGFGQEWQVRDSDHKLFQVVDRFPQHPDACVMPTMTTASERRRLGEWMISKEDAREVCAMWKHKRDMTACMYDVMFTGNLASALTGVF